MANPKLLKDYSDIIEDYKAQSIVEEVTDVGPPSKTHYLPHRAVLHEEHNTTKTRVVFDASSKLESPSLNEQLHQGPCLLPLLFDVLYQFRMNEVALVSDLRQAFLQIEIAPTRKNASAEFASVTDDPEILDTELMIVPVQRNQSQVCYWNLSSIKGYPFLQFFLFSGFSHF